MANHQTNFTSNFGEMGETGNAAFVLNVNGTDHTYHPIGSDVRVDVATVRRIPATAPNLAQSIATVLAAGGYPVLVYDGSEYGYIRTTSTKYVFTCIASLNTVKQAEVDIQNGTITAAASDVGGVSILSSNESDLFVKIGAVLALDKVPIILDNGAYYHLITKASTVAQFARNTSSGTLQVLSVDNNNQITSSSFTFLESTGDASNVTSTFTKDSGDTSTMDSGSKLSVIFTAISSFFASVLSAFGDKTDKVQGATAGNLAALDASGNLTDSGKKAADFKTKQTPVANPSASGNGLDFIDSISQNTNGEITPHKKSVQDGTTAQKGVVQLQDSIGSTESATDKAVTPHAVREAINAAVSSAYHAAGTKTVAQLTSSLLVAKNEGCVYNVTDSGTTTSDFVDGAGHPINAGDNVAVCDVGGSVYKFDLLSGFVDLTNYLTKTGDASNTTSTFTKTSGDTSSMTSGGKLSAIFTAISSFFASVVSALGGKADKANVTGATKCKITYNGQGIVTSGADLSASDIPNLAASKITSGTFGTSFIADDAITAAKVKDNETLPVNISGNAGSSYTLIGKDMVLGSNGYSLLATLELSNVNAVYAGAMFAVVSRGGGACLEGIVSVSLSEYTNAGNETAPIVGNVTVMNCRGANLDALTAKFDFYMLRIEACNYQLFVHKKENGLPVSCTLLAATECTCTLYSSDTIANLPSAIETKKLNWICNKGVGSTTTPVYVDSNGQVQPCTPSSMYVGWASNVNLSKTVNAVNGDSIQAGTGSAVTIGNAGNAKKWDGHAISVGTVVSNAGTISIA